MRFRFCLKAPGLAARTLSFFFPGRSSMRYPSRLCWHVGNDSELCRVSLLGASAMRFRFCLRAPLTLAVVVWRIGSDRNPRISIGWLTAGAHRQESFRPLGKD